MPDEPKRFRAVITDNVFHGVDTAAKISGDIDVEYQRNSHTDTRQGLVHESSHNNGNPTKKWYERPIGVVALSVSAALISAAILGGFGLIF